MATVPTDIFAIEKGFWTGDEAYYQKHTDAECLVAFADMPGVMENGDLAATAKDGRRWRDLELEPKGAVQPTADTLILTYEATATKESGEPYAALVTTGYVQRGDDWKMMFHGQTPH